MYNFKSENTFKFVIQFTRDQLSYVLNFYFYLTLKFDFKIFSFIKKKKNEKRWDDRSRVNFRVND